MCGNKTTDVGDHIARGEIEEAKAILAKAEGKSWDELPALKVFPVSIMIQACSYKRTVILKYLLDEKKFPWIDVNGDSWCTSPVIMCFFADFHEGVKLLLKRPDFKHDAEDEENLCTETVMWMACWYGKDAIINTLLDSGRDFNFKKKRQHRSHGDVKAGEKMSCFAALDKSKASKETKMRVHDYAMKHKKK